MHRLVEIVILVSAVVTTAQSSRALSLHEVVATKLIARYALDTSTNKIEVLKSQLPNDQVDPTQVTIQPLFQREPVGLVSVVAIVTDSAGTVRRGQCNLRVRKLAEVAVTKSAIKLHTEIKPEQYEFKLMDVTSLREQPLSSPGAILGSRTKRNLAAGQILTAEAIETAPDIEVGREVTITFAGEAFSITTRGLALQPGHVGEMIKVKNAVSGKTVVARMTGDRDVHVEL